MIGCGCAELKVLGCSLTMACILQQRNIGAEGRFATLRLKNVRCFDETETVFAPRMTVIIGETGAGKTIVGEAMVSPSDGADGGLRHFPQQHGKRTGHIAFAASGRCGSAGTWMKLLSR
jgi:recombinational DNA repair ATPase RecF